METLNFNFCKHFCKLHIHVAISRQMIVVSKTSMRAKSR